MTEVSELLHYGVIASTVGFSAVGVGIGQGLTSVTALDAINRQPNARGDITKAAVLGMALIETAAIMGTFVAIYMLVAAPKDMINSYGHIASLGIGLALCLPSLVIGIFSALPAQAACIAIARQPFSAQKIIRFMLLSLSIIQTPVIFALIIGFLIHGELSEAITLRDTLRLIGSGLSIGLGSVGPAIGLCLFAQAANEGMGVNREAHNSIFSFTFISQAIIETPIILSLIIASWLLLVIPSVVVENELDGIILLSAGIAASLGTIGVGISSGRTAATACRQIAKNPAMYSSISRVSFFAQGLIETCTIYPWLIALVLILSRG